MTTFVNNHPVAHVTTLLMNRKGIDVIRIDPNGSKTAPVRAAAKAVRKGSSLGITPDGPLGPRNVVQPGAVMIAALSQVRLSPVAFSTRRRITLKTWDRFMIPLPFGRGAFVMADGDIPPRRMDGDQMDAAQKRLGVMIDEVCAEADRIVDL